MNMKQDSPATKYIVTKNWEKSYPDPIILQKGDRVVMDLSIKDSTPGWDNWVWCIAADGSTGWVPAQVLETINTLAEDRSEALVTADYSAAELTVGKGEILTGTYVLNGWVWCKAPDGNTEGWVPSDNVRPVSI